jgi:hypothetical protein
MLAMQLLQKKTSAFADISYKYIRFHLVDVFVEASSVDFVLFDFRVGMRLVY